MARFIDAIDIQLDLPSAFEYLADFSRTAEWDPGVERATRLTPGEPALGSRFEVVVSFLGRKMPLDYEITRFDPPHALVLAGGDETLRSDDEINFVERGGGTRIFYEARLELLGIRRIADPLLDLLFQRVGRLATRGLRERLDAEAGASGAPRPQRASASPQALSFNRKETSNGKDSELRNQDSSRDA